MSDKPGKCDTSTDEKKNEYMSEAAAVVGGREYGSTQVTVKSRSGNTVRLGVSRNNGTSTGIIELEWGNLDQMWASCPSSLPSSAAPGNAGSPPTSGDGTLYLTQAALSLTSNIDHGPVKFPREWAADDDYYQDLKIWPTQITVTGIAEGSGIEDPLSIDVLDPSIAKPDQEIRTDHRSLTLSLTRTGVEAMGRSFDASRHLKAAIQVIEKEKSDPDKLVEAWRIVALTLKQRRSKLTPDNPGWAKEIDMLLHRVLVGYEA